MGIEAGSITSTATTGFLAQRFRVFGPVLSKVVFTSECVTSTWRIVALDPIYAQRHVPLALPMAAARGLVSAHP